MRSFASRFAAAGAFVLALAREAHADIPPQPDPSDPTTWVAALAVGIAITSGVVFYIRRRRRQKQRRD